MNNALVIVGSIFVFIAAVIHLLIFFMESVLWSKPAIWKRFGLKTQQEADVVRPMAFNQGFYNVFLAIGAGTGLVMMGSTNWQQGGVALAIFACASMVLASIVLVTSSPKLARAAAIQGLAPLVGIIFLALALLTT
jgi:putative membrane protein